jgi:hypothetical protein
MTVEFSRQILENAESTWKPDQWVSSCSMRTDRHVEANSRVSQSYERA